MQKITEFVQTYSYYKKQQQNKGNRSNKGFNYRRQRQLLNITKVSRKFFLIQRHVVSLAIHRHCYGESAKEKRPYYYKEEKRNKNFFKQDLFHLV